MKTACVFAHYDRHGKVDDYVLYYLRELQKVAELIQFVTTADLSDTELRKVEDLGVNVIQRKNEGYDFYSYKLGIEAIDLSRFDELIVCNDSVYGPFSELATVLGEMRARGANYWGLTDSFDFYHHLQSYFFVFSGDALRSHAFEDFWQSMEILDDKEEIIRRYEVGLSRSMAAAGFQFEALARSRKFSNLRHIGSHWRYYCGMLWRRWKEPMFWANGFRVVSGKLHVARNPTHIGWRFLIRKGGVPFVKVELLRDNPKGINDLDRVFTVIQSVGDYPVQYIEDHLRRMRDSQSS